MTQVRALHPATEPPTRGRLLSPAEIVALIGGDSPVSEQWVRRTVPYKMTLSHSVVRWYEADVLAWLEARRKSA